MASRCAEKTNMYKSISGMVYSVWIQYNISTPCWNEEERAIVGAFNAARPNVTLNANEKAVMQMISDGNVDGL